MRPTPTPRQTVHDVTPQSLDELRRPLPDAAPGPAARRRPPLLALVALLSTVVALMLLAFVTPALHSGAEDLPVAVAGPAPAVERLTATLDARQPGALALETRDSSDDVVRAVRERDAVGGLVLAPDGVTVYTAAGAGSPYAGVLRGVGGGLAASGQPVRYEELAPLPADDPAGVAVSTLALPLVFGGMASAAVLSMVYGHSRRLRVLGAFAVAVVGGLAVTALLHGAFHVLTGNVWLEAGVVVLGMAAISMTVLGLHSLLGPAGLGVGAVLMLFIANPLSGMATGPQWLPAPWGAIGQGFPVGAAGNALRSAAYFEGHGVLGPVLVLTAWALGGLALNFAGHLHHTRRTAV